MRGSITPRRLSARHSHRRVWDVRVDAPPGADGKRRQLRFRGFETRKAAEQKLSEVLHELRTGAHVPRSATSFASFALDEWLPAISHRHRVNTRESYAWMLRRYVLPRIGGIRLQQLDVQTLNALYAELLAKGGKDGKPLSARTVSYAHTIIRKALKDAVRWQRIPRNPATLAEPPSLTRSPRPVWSSTQIADFLHRATSDPLYEVFLLAATTGLRRSEILGLRWGDLDLKNRTLSVRQTLVSINGKPTFGTPKTPRSKRTISLDPETGRRLREYRAREVRRLLSLGVALSDEDLIFTSPEGRPLRPDSVSQAFRRRVGKLGLPPLSFHGLRHSYATAALARGVPEKFISDRLGHSSISVTMDIYTRLDPALEKASTDAVAAALFGSENEAGTESGRET